MRDAGKGTQEHRVGEREERGVRADAKSKREDDDRGESGRASQLSRRVFEIVQDAVHCVIRSAIELEVAPVQRKSSATRSYSQTPINKPLTNPKSPRSCTTVIEHGTASPESERWMEHHQCMTASAGGARRHHSFPRP